MSDLLRSIVMGVIQGLTEFLPVSSSGHLELAKYILGDPEVGQTSLMFTLVLHFATALSTLVVFRKDVLEILKGLFKPEGVEQRRFSLNIVLSMIPAAIVGFTAEPLIEGLFDQNIAFVGLMLIVTGILLLMADRSKQTNTAVDAKKAVIIGFAQAVALIPGISRSGATIATSVMLGVDRYKAARFSFLMVVPLILGKMGYDVISGDLNLHGEGLAVIGAGFVAAFLSGALACTWMITLVRKSKLKYFAAYCAGVGLFAIIWSLSQ